VVGKCLSFTLNYRVAWSALVMIVNLTSSPTYVDIFNGRHKAMIGSNDGRCGLSRCANCLGEVKIRRLHIDKQDVQCNARHPLRPSDDHSRLTNNSRRWQDAVLECSTAVEVLERSLLT
jgi:hypothetical protein